MIQIWPLRGLSSRASLTNLSTPKARASRSAFYSLHAFKFSFCNLIVKLNSILLYCKYELNFFKVIDFVFEFK